MQINPYLSFRGDCEAAFHFYEQCLGGELGPIFGDLRICARAMNILQ